MSLHLIEAPQDRIVTLEEAKAWCRVRHPDEDSVFELIIAAVDQWLDGADGILGRSVNHQVWQLRLPYFPVNGCIEIPLPPLLSVDSIQHYDADNVLQTVSTDVYEVLTKGGKVPGEIRLKWGQTWPSSVYQRGEAVLITFHAGYDDGGSPREDAIPPGIKQAALAQIAHMYANREAVMVGVSVTTVPMLVNTLLMPHIVPKFA